VTKQYSKYFFSIGSHDTLMILVSANGFTETTTIIRLGQCHCHWKHFFWKQKKISL